MPSQRYGEGKPSMMQKKGKSALFYTRFPLVFHLVMMIFFPWLCCRPEQFDYYKTVLTGMARPPS